MSALTDLIASAAQRYGQDPGTLLRVAQVESNLDPGAHNSSGASGLFQFMPGTAARYGLTNPNDPAASADAGARLLRDNRAALMRVLGRDPTGPELYLAHQQGAGGASALLANPSAPAASIVGSRAVLQNGGTQGMTAQQFANLEMGRFAPASSSPPAGHGSLGALFATPTAAGESDSASQPRNAQPEASAIPSNGAMAVTSQPPAAQPAMASQADNRAVAQALLRKRALITGQGGLGALFA